MMIWLLVLAGCVLALALAGASLYMADLFARSKRCRVEGTPAQFGLRYEDVQFRAADGAVLRGWLLDSPGARATIVLVHDGDGNRADRRHGLLGLQSEYVRSGYNVFAFDLRGRGESSGSRDHLGSLERLDLAAALRVTRRRFGGLPLIVHGFGLGAALAIDAVAGGASVQGVIADSAAISERALLRSRWRRLPAPLFVAACRMARRVYRADVAALAPIEVISRVAPTPLLMIHGEDDEQVPVAHAYNLSAATLHGRCELWTVPDAGHCAGYVVDPEAYLRRCLAFAEQVVPARLLASVG